MADVNQENSRSVSDTLDLVDATGNKVNQAARRGVSETLDRAEEAGQTLNRAGREIADSVSLAYQTMFSFSEVRRMSETYIEMNERMAKESFDYNLRLIEIWFEGARKLWQAAEEGQREAASRA